MNPSGGTELQMQFLEQHVDKTLLEQVQITTTVPEKIPLAKDKVNILWQHNSYDQPNLAPWFKDKSNHLNMIGMYSIVIGTFEKYRMMFDIPCEKSISY
jgi:hypothetical protein